MYFHCLTFFQLCTFRNWPFHPQLHFLEKGYQFNRTIVKKDKVYRPEQTTSKVVVAKFTALELCQNSCHGTELWVDKVKTRLNLFLKFLHSSSFFYRSSLGMLFFITAETPWNWFGFSYLHLEPEPYHLFKSLLATDGRPVNCKDK